MMSLFSVNTKEARIHKFLPNRGKADDAPTTCEIQIRNAVCLPSAAAAVVLAEGGAEEFEHAFFGTGGSYPQRFYGIDEIAVFAEFANRHKVKFDGQGEERVSLIDKIRLRIEGGPQRIVWADFSIHIDDPDVDLVSYLHEHCNRSVSMVLTQDADLVDEMLATRKGMAVTTIPGELDFDTAERDAAQIDQAARGLEGAASAEIPLKTKRGPRKPAKKAAGKRRKSKKAA